MDPQTDLTIAALEEDVAHWHRLLDNRRTWEALVRLHRADEARADALCAYLFGHPVLGGRTAGDGHG